MQMNAHVNTARKNPPHLYQHAHMYYLTLLYISVHQILTRLHGFTAPNLAHVKQVPGYAFCPQGPPIHHYMFCTTKSCTCPLHAAEYVS